MDGTFAGPFGKVGTDVRPRKVTWRRSRSAVGMAELPFRVPVEIEAEVELIAP